MLKKRHGWKPSKNNNKIPLKSPRAHRTDSQKKESLVSISFEIFVSYLRWVSRRSPSFCKLVRIQQNFEFFKKYEEKSSKKYSENSWSQNIQPGWIFPSEDYPSYFKLSLSIKNDDYQWIRREDKHSSVWLLISEVW